MAKSFYYGGTDASLYTGSQAFSTKITATPTAFGLVAGQAVIYATAALNYKNAYLAANDPEQKNKSRTIAKDAARQILRDATAALAKIIEANPAVTAEQKNDLGLSVRATPTNAPPPGTPNTFGVALTATGALNLKWKCSNPTAGTMYQLYRKIDDGADVYIGGSGSKKFTDAGIPVGAGVVSYSIQALRSSAAGAWATFQVKLGTAPGGGMTALVTKSEPARIAA